MAKALAYHVLQSCTRCVRPWNPTRTTRQGKLAEQRAQLDLQVRLLAEQKTATLLALLEARRRDLPEVTNRHDAEAAAMEQATDPHAILDALETLHESVPAEADHEPREQSDAGDGRSPAGR